MSRAPRTLFVLVDGLGLGPRDPATNPIHQGVSPVLERLLAEHALPIDAGMGVPGIPQSATGQTALFTGVNAAQVVGRHVEGFPGPALRELVRAHNVYDQLASLGVRCTFANAYFTTDMDEVRTRKIQSVTTVAALKAFDAVRDVHAMLAGQAVCQDLTRASLRERGYDGPLISPQQSAHDLIRVAGDFDFTVFEYFQTDRVGHKGGPDDVRRVLAQFDEFLGGLMPFASQAGCLFVMTSDHGNIEDAGSRLHSGNPVPLVAIGEGAGFLHQRVRSVTDVTPALVELYRSTQSPRVST